MKKIIICLSLMLSACMGPQIADLARPTVVIEGGGVQNILNKVSELCRRNGLLIQSRTASNVVCGRQSSSAAQMFGMISGDIKTKFNVFDLGQGVTKIAPRSWVEGRTASGTIQKTDYDAPDIRASTQKLLEQIKFELNGRRK